MTWTSRSSALDNVAVAEKEDFTWKGSDEFSDLGDRSESLRKAASLGIDIYRDDMYNDEGMLLQL